MHNRNQRNTRKANFGINYIALSKHEYLSAKNWKILGQRLRDSMTANNRPI